MNVRPRIALPLALAVSTLAGCASAPSPQTATPTKPVSTARAASVNLSPASGSR